MVFWSFLYIFCVLYIPSKGIPHCVGGAILCSVLCGWRWKLRGWFLTRIETNVSSGNYHIHILEYMYWSFYGALLWILCWFIWSDSSLLISLPSVYSYLRLPKQTFVLEAIVVIYYIYLFIYCFFLFFHGVIVALLWKPCWFIRSVSYVLISLPSVYLILILFITIFILISYYLLFCKLVYE